MSLLAIALDHLSLGRAHLLATQQEGTDNVSQAAVHLDQAVDGLRRSGLQEFLARGLLARAVLHRWRSAFEQTHQDLDEALAIANLGSMGLYQADAHLEYARLYLAMGKKDQARASWVTAKEMIERMGYHRRDKELDELEKQLQTYSPSSP